jgi:hypothetical protein
MFDKAYFDDFQSRLEKYFRRYPSAERVAILLSTGDEEYLLVEIIDYDERFVTFLYWPRDNSDLPKRWEDIQYPLPAVTVTYPDIRSIEYSPSIVKGREIGFSRSGRG